MDAATPHHRFPGPGRPAVAWFSFVAGSQLHAPAITEVEGASRPSSPFSFMSLIEVWHCISRKGIPSWLHASPVVVGIGGAYVAARY